MRETRTKQFRGPHVTIITDAESEGTGCMA